MPLCFPVMFSKFDIRFFIGNLSQKRVFPRQEFRDIVSWTFVQKLLTVFTEFTAYYLQKLTQGSGLKDKIQSG